LRLTDRMNLAGCSAHHVLDQLIKSNDSLASCAAAALLAGIQGGVSVLLNTGDISYLEAALDVGIANLRK